VISIARATARLFRAMLPHGFPERFTASYYRLFGLKEIADAPILQWSFGASLLFFFLTFSSWISSNSITVETAKNGRAVCWPYVQQCYQWYFLHALPYGYSQSIFYMMLYGVMLLIVWALWRKRYATAHALLSILLLWEILVVFFLSYVNAAPYFYYHIVLTSILLFGRHKEFFLKFSYVFMYFMSVTTKYDSTWILGSYFTALKTGLPIFPTALTPLFTNLVIFMQTIGCWFLLSRRILLQRLVLFYFVVFHLYSGILVMYLYPTVTLPFLLVLFGPLYRPTPIPYDRKTAFGWTIIALLALFQIIGFWAPGDRRMTLEGDKFGMFMFEANHQCVVTYTTYRKSASNVQPLDVPNGTPCNGFFCLVNRSVQKEDTLYKVESRFESSSAWNRCYPYIWWSRAQADCQRPNIAQVGIKIDHSIDGGPFYRIVNVPDICGVPYNAFGPNDWITQPPVSPLDGYPVQNTYHY
jgi:hypothetical protein